jgi:signal transduction histidine kinase
MPGTVAALATSTLIRGSVRPGFADELLSLVGAAGDVRAGLLAVFERLVDEGAAAGVQWWAPAGDGCSLRQVLSAGQAYATSRGVPLGAAGAAVLVGEHAGGVEAMLTQVGVVVRHRWAAERLAEHAARLSRQNEALADSAALVAHDVRSALVSALVGDAPREALVRALGLVDSILEVARADAGDRRGGGGVASAADCVRQAVADLGGIDAEVVTNVADEFPMPAAALRVVLRNLLANAVAAGARRIHVSGLAQGNRWVLVVDDDGVGLDAPSGYATGAQLGLALCRRLVARYAGVLELKARAVRGARAVIVLNGAEG